MKDNWKAHDDDTSMPIGTGPENGQDEIAFPAERKPRVQPINLVLTGVVAGGLALLYLLGQQHTPRSANAAQAEDETQINSALERLAHKNGNVDHLQSLFADTDKLVKLFNEYPGKVSTPLEDLPGNPFEQVGAPKKGTDPVMVDMKPRPDENAAELARQAKLAESFNQLKLQSVMVSKDFNAAQINGKLLTVGAKIGDFTVDAIEAKRVIVRNGSDRFELLLDKPKADQ